MNTKYQILLFYKYINLEDPESIKNWQIKLCKELELKSRIIVAKEGINGTLEGTVENTERYIEEMSKDQRFSDIVYKKSKGTGNAFPKVSVKVRAEIVTLKLGENDFSPQECTGRYITAEELYSWFTNQKEFYIVDMRNDYEHKVGFFENSILMPIKNFRELPNKIQHIEHLKEKTVVTVCTGGVRCEKASGLLIKHGFKDVYQLKDGIVTFMEKFPNKFFLGKLYVFDNRFVMGFNTDIPEHIIVGRCDKCNKPTDNYIDCAYIHCNSDSRHFLCCSECQKNLKNLYCCQHCYSKNNIY